LRGDSRGKENTLKTGADGKMILEWMFKKSDDGEEWTGLIWLRIGTGGGYL